MTSDPFPGTWVLDPDTLDYQFGRPGRRATYVIEAIPDGLLFHLDAEDADKNPIKVTYGGKLDGTDQPLPGADAALVLTRFGENMIESTLKRQGKVVDRWTREMLPDRRRMKITQHVLRPNGEEFRNTSLYRKIAD
jgi:hypothetical protein